MGSQPPFSRESDGQPRVEFVIYSRVRGPFNLLGREPSRNSVERASGTRGVVLWVFSARETLGRARCSPTNSRRRTRHKDALGRAPFQPFFLDKSVRTPHSRTLPHYFSTALAHAGNRRRPAR